MLQMISVINQDQGLVSSLSSLHEKKGILCSALVFPTCVFLLWFLFLQCGAPNFNLNITAQDGNGAGRDRGSASRPYPDPRTLLPAPSPKRWGKIVSIPGPLGSPKLVKSRPCSFSSKAFRIGTSCHRSHKSNKEEKGISSNKSDCMFLKWPYMDRPTNHASRHYRIYRTEIEQSRLHSSSDDKAQCMHPHACLHFPIVNN
jgi:hypothetical protein